MARQYYRKQDPAAQGENVVWIEMSGQEFYQFSRSPESQGRYFIDMDDVVIEAPREIYEEWHREKARCDYWREKRRRDGFVVLSLHSDAICEHGQGGDVIPDESVHVEDTAILLAETAALRRELERLDTASYLLIYDLYLAKERKTLRKLSQESGIPVMTLQNRKAKILVQLRKRLSGQKKLKSFPVQKSQKSAIESES